MKQTQYRKGLRVRQRAVPINISSIRRTGVTVSEVLCQRKPIDRPHYCRVQWDGSSRSEWVHFTAIEIVEEVRDA